MAILNHPQQQPVPHHPIPKQEPPPHPAPPHKAGPDRGKMSDDQNNALNIHNQARTNAIHYFGHPRGDLVWDDQLAANATAYARRLASANQGLHHSDGNSRPNQGENLYWSKPNGSLADASTGWVNEQKSYHGEKIGEGDFGSYGHYTQVIWPTTTNVGIGMAQASDGGWFIVGRYSPPGNWTGKNAFTGE